MPNYFSSTNVRVFPSTYRTFNAAGRFTSETNFTNLVKALAGKDSFVVDHQFINSRYKLMVVIKGYYFEIYDITPKDNLSFKINADSGFLMSFNDDINLDVSNEFRGLYYSESILPDADLVVYKNGKLVNKGYIDELCDSEGNWINIQAIFDLFETYVDEEGITHFIIKQDALHFDSPTYIKNLIAQYATHISDESGNIIKNIGSNKKPIYINANGEFAAFNTRIGSAIQPIYLNNNGEITASNGSVGTKNYVSSTKTMTAQNVYLSNGIITGGQKIIVSKSNPSGSGFEAGDLWFVIES